MAGLGFDKLSDFLRSQIALCGASGAGSKEFYRFVNKYYEESGAPIPAGGFNRNFYAKVWEWLANHPHIQIVSRNRILHNPSLSAFEALECSERSPDHDPTPATADAASVPAQAPPKPPTIPTTGYSSLGGALRQRLAKEGIEPDLSDKSSSSRPREPVAMTGDAPHVSGTVSGAERHAQDSSNGQSEQTMGVPYGSSAHSPYSYVQGAAANSVSSFGQPSDTKKRRGPRNAPKGNQMKVPVFDQPPSNITAPRIYASQNAMWQAVAGHPMDLKKIPSMEFMLLSIIAAYGADGIAQPTLVKLSGQDKRSVPHRTDELARKGYIDKKPVQAGKLRTSLCVHKMFVKEDHFLNKPQGVEDVFRNGTFVLPGFVHILYDLLQESGIVAMRDLRTKLGVPLDIWNGRAARGAIRRLDQTGFIKLVRARRPNPRKGTKDAYLPCIKLQRAPTDEDMVNLKFRSLIKKADEETETLPRDDDGDTLMRDGDEDAADHSDRDDQDVSEQVGRIPPQWTPDKLLGNWVFEAIEAAGVDAWDGATIRDRVTGRFWKRPLEAFLSRLTDNWEQSQPLYLRHLALIRDTNISQGQKRVHYVYRTYGNFQKAVDLGYVEWEGVSKEAANVPFDKKRGRPKKGANNDSILNAWGFKELNESDFHRKDGSSTLSECRATVKRGPTLNQTWDNELVRQMGYLKPGRPHSSPQSSNPSTDLTLQDGTHLSSGRNAGVGKYQKPAQPLKISRALGGFVLTKEQRIALGVPERGRLLADIERQVKAYREKTGDPSAIPEVITKTEDREPRQTLKQPLLTKEERIAQGLPEKGRLGKDLTRKLREEKNLPAAKTAKGSKSRAKKDQQESPVLTKEQRVARGLPSTGRLSKAFLDEIRRELNSDLPHDSPPETGISSGANGDETELDPPADGEIGSYPATPREAQDEAQSSESVETFESNTGVPLARPEAQNLAKDTSNFTNPYIVLPSSPPNLARPVKRKGGQDTGLFTPVLKKVRGTSTPQHDLAEGQPSRDVESFTAGITVSYTTRSIGRGRPRKALMAIIASPRLKDLDCLQSIPPAISAVESTLPATISSTPEPPLAATINSVPESTSAPQLTAQPEEATPPMANSQPIVEHSKQDEAPKDLDKEVSPIPRLQSAGWGLPRGASLQNTPKTYLSPYSLPPVPFPTQYSHIDSHPAAPLPGFSEQMENSPQADTPAPANESSPVQNFVIANTSVETTSTTDMSADQSEGTPQVQPVETGDPCIESSTQEQSSVQSPVTRESENALENVSQQNPQVVNPLLKEENAISSSTNPQKAQRPKRTGGFTSRGVTLGRGNLWRFRTGLIREILQLCNGVFPCNGEISDPFYSLWDKRAPKQMLRPDRSTLTSTIKNMINDPENGLKRLSFHIPGFSGTCMIQKFIIAYEHLSPTSPEVEQLRTKMIQAYPNRYYPEEVKHLMPEVPNPRKRLVLPEIDESIKPNDLYPLLARQLDQRISASAKERKKTGSSNTKEIELEKAVAAAVKRTGSKIRSKRLARLEDQMPGHIDVRSRLTSTRSVDIMGSRDDAASDSSDDVPLMMLHKLSSKVAERHKSANLSDTNPTSEHETEQPQPNDKDISKKSAGVSNTPRARKQDRAAKPTGSIFDFYPNNGTFSTVFVLPGIETLKSSARGNKRAKDTEAGADRPKKRSRTSKAAPAVLEMESDFTDSDASCLKELPKSKSKRPKKHDMPDPTLLERLTGLTGDPGDPIYEPPVKKHNREKEKDKERARKKKKATDASVRAHPLQKFCITIVIARTLSQDDTVDWNIVKEVYKSNRTFDPYRAKQTWLWMQEHMASYIKSLTKRFERSFLEAYTAGEIEEIDDTDSFDYPTVVQWALGNCKFPKPPTLLADREAMADWEIVESNYEVLDRAAWYKQKLAAIHRAMRIARHAYVLPLRTNNTNGVYPKRVISKQTLAISPPLPYNSSLWQDSEDTIRARSWIRSNTATPEDLYQGSYAHEKLSVLGESILAGVVEDLVENKYIRMRKIKRLLPGRNFNFTATFAKFYRRNFQLEDFMNAAELKKDMDKAFAQQDPSQRTFGITRTADDGAVMAVLSLVQDGQIKLVPRLPPVNNAVRAPFPRISVWGICGNNYKHRAIPRDRLFWPVDAVPTEKYQFGNPLLPTATSVALASGGEYPLSWTELPEPPLPGKGFDSPNAMLPIWSSISGESIIWPWWYRILNLVIQPLVFHPGATATQILLHCPRHTTELFEVQMVLDWLVSANAAKKLIGNGYQIQEGFWAAFGDKLIDIEEDWYNNHVFLKRNKFIKESWRDHFNKHFAELDRAERERELKEAQAEAGGDAAADASTHPVGMDIDGQLDSPLRPLLFGNSDLTRRILENPRKQYSIVKQAIKERDRAGGDKTMAGRAGVKKTKAKPKKKQPKKAKGAKKDVVMEDAADTQSEKLNPQILPPTPYADSTMVDADAEGSDVDAEGEIDEEYFSPQSHGSTPLPFPT